MPIITTAYAKRFIGITGTDEDDRLDALCNVADAAIKRATGRDLEQASYAPGGTSTPVRNGYGDSGYYNGDNSPYLILRQRPVTTLTSIYLDNSGRFGDNPDGSFDSSTLLVAGTDYVLEWDGLIPGTSTRCSYKGVVRKLFGTWPAFWRYQVGVINPGISDHTGNIKVTYTAGFPASAIPPDLQYAGALLVARMRRTAEYGTGHLEYEKYEDYAYKLAPVASSMLYQVGELQHIIGKYREVYI